MKLLIPTAKIVPSDLQNIGKLPAIIYPINDGIVFDFFKDKYGDVVSEIDILCYERASEVKKRLHPFVKSSNLKFIELEKLRDLGHTVYEGLEDVDEEILINFGDTIVRDSLPLYKKNFVAYVKDFPNELWTYFEIIKGEITFVCDKKNITGREKKPLFIGVFKIQSGLYLKKCLEQAFIERDERMDSFYHALMLYSKKFPLEEIRVEEWLDIGHTRGYFESKLAVRAREFNHIRIDKERGILKKTSKDKDKFIGEVKWYLKLPEDLEYVRPRIFSYSTHYENPYVAMEYYSYHTLHELFLYGDLSYEQWDSIFRHIYFIINDFRRYQLRDTGINRALQEMYLDKTLSRLQSLEKDSNFEKLFIDPIVINGIVYKPLNKISKVLAEKVPDLLYDVEKFHIIHGDLCFTNIMVDNNFSFIKLIDPRGRFGQYDIYGDGRYEIAKMLHSLEGKYDFIIKDLFELEIQNKSEFYFKIAEDAKHFGLLKIFLSIFGELIGEELPQIEMIQALLFLSMIPLHSENLRHQFAMLCTGIMLLDKVINLKC